MCNQKIYLCNGIVQFYLMLFDVRPEICDKNSFLEGKLKRKSEILGIEGENRKLEGPNTGNSIITALIE